MTSPRNIIIPLRSLNPAHGKSLLNVLSWYERPISGCAKLRIVKSPPSEFVENRRETHSFTFIAAVATAALFTSEVSNAKPVHGIAMHG